VSLGARLEAIVALVPLGSSIADVGSDHATVPLALFSQGSIAFAQCIENKKGPYERMKKALAKLGPDCSYVASLSDGLKEADPRIDCAILAGLGGELISSILRRDLLTHPNIKTVIIDPHSERPSAYRALMELGYKEERSVSLVEADHYYEVSRWVKVPTAVPYTDQEIAFGPLPLAEKPLEWCRYWENEAERLRQIEDSLGDEQAKKAQLEERISHIEEVLK
jgi:tRNA (adenine22-N1)-methyltransferase